jgi:hypothetical protein
MTWSFLFYRLLRVARHPWCSGEDLPQLVHHPRGRQRLCLDSGRLQVQTSSVLPNSRIQVSLPALLLHRQVKGAPPGGQALPPFGSPPLRIPSLRPTTSMPPTVRQAYVKIGFVCLLDYIAFLTCSFTCLSGWLRITTRWQEGIWLPRRPLEPNGRIHRQRRGDVVLVSFIFQIVLSCRIIVLSCRTCFAFACRELYWMSCCCVWYVIYSACFGGSPSGEAVKIGSSKKSYIHQLTDDYRTIFIG